MAGKWNRRRFLKSAGGAGLVLAETGLRRMREGIAAAGL